MFDVAHIFGNKLHLHAVIFQVAFIQIRDHLGHGIFNIDHVRSDLPFNGQVYDPLAIGIDDGANLGDILFDITDIFKTHEGIALAGDHHLFHLLEIAKTTQRT